MDLMGPYGHPKWKGLEVAVSGKKGPFSFFYTESRRGERAGMEVRKTVEVEKRERRDLWA